MSIDQITLASRLKEARATAGFTQEQVAIALELPRTAIVQIESGSRTVSTLELASLAQLYGRPIASFFSEAPPSEEEDALVAVLLLCICIL
jgi:transcriptional regulator with XRE-family HTH domain